MEPPESALLDLFRAFVHHHQRTELFSVGGDKKEYVVACANRRQTLEILQYWESLGLKDQGHKLVLRGGGHLYGISPMPQNEGIVFKPKPSQMLTAFPEHFVSIREMMQSLNPSDALKCQIRSLYNSKGVFIYKNRPDEGYPCALALPPITPARLNKPIEEYIGQPIRAIDSDISSQRQNEIERLLEDKQPDSILYRRCFNSEFVWENRKWTLINEVWFSPEDEVIIVTVEDPHDQKGLRQKSYFLDMIDFGFAQPNPNIPWATIF